MKKFSIRAFVLTLALTGAVATSVSSAAAATRAHKVTTASFTDPSDPMPLCKPNSGQYCGLK